MLAPAVKRLCLAVPATLLLALVLASPPLARAQPGVVHVNSATGADGPTCGGAASPCRTPGYAAGRAAPGDTLELAAGTYTTGFNLTRPLTIRGPNAGRAGADGSRGPEAVVTSLRWNIQSGSVTIDGLRFQGAINAGGAGVIQSDGGLSGLADVTIRNSVFSGLNRSAVHVNLNAANRATNTRWTVERNLVENLTSSRPDQNQWAGFTLWGLGAVTVRDNVVRNTNAAAIQLDGNSDSLVERNTISDTFVQAITLAGPLRNVTVRENSITRANSGGDFARGALRISADAFAGPVRVLNNTVQDTLVGAYVRPAGFTHSLVTIRGNHFLGTLLGVLREGAAGTVDARCNAWGDPSGPLAESNPSGAGALALSLGGGPLPAAPWLNTAADADPALPGVQRPDTVLAVAPGEVSDAVNDFRAVANAVGCAEAGQTIVLRGVFDWSQGRALASWRLGVDQLAGTADDTALQLPDPGGPVTLRAETPGGATLRGAAAEPGGRGPALAGAARWSVSNLELDGLQTAFFVDPAATGTLQVRDVALTAGVAVGVDAEAPGATVSAECVFWGAGSGPAAAANPGGAGARVRGAISFQPFAPGRFACAPTPVTLASFTAARAGGAVRLAWASASEVGIAGYRLYRGPGPRWEDAAPLGPALIPAEGAGPGEASYSFADPGAPATAYYWLESVEAAPARYGPLASVQVFVPLVGRP